MLSFFMGQKKFKYKQTFTYYIPAPPSRKTGYHEKEFDIITRHLQEKGFEILEFQTQAHSAPEGGGIWIVCLLGTNAKQLADERLQIDFIEIANKKDASMVDPDIIHEI